MNEYKFYFKTYFLDLFAYFMCMGVVLSDGREKLPIPWNCSYGWLSAPMFWDSNPQCSELLSHPSSSKWVQCLIVLKFLV